MASPIEFLQRRRAYGNHRPGSIAATDRVLLTWGGKARIWPARSDLESILSPRHQPPEETLVLIRHGLPAIALLGSRESFLTVGLHTGRIRQ